MSASARRKHNTFSEIDAILKSLGSHAVQSLETPATNFTSLSFSGANLADATRKGHSLQSIKQHALLTKDDFLMLYGVSCAYLHGFAVWYV